MSMRAALQQYIKANPGKPLRDIVAGIGLTERAHITTASAQLCQLVAKGKLRAEQRPGQARGMLYHPTPLTGINRRRPPATPEVAAERKREYAQRKAAKARAQRATKRKLTHAQHATFYGTDLPAQEALPASAPPKAAALPPNRVQITISRRQLAAPKARFAPTAEPETVEQWMARTGQQPERLPPHACGKPVLRFDHSDNTVPTGRRRPALRVRGAHRA